jgi:ATP-binding cassette subfamily B (MDR/TAP) protein 1
MITLVKASSSAEELFKTIDRQSEIDPLSDKGEAPADCTGVIELTNVSFAYPTRLDTPVINRLTLSVPANKTTAIVGASGSGKSTIIGLLGIIIATSPKNPER